VANAWREHPRLRGRFLLDHQDDLQVVVHDGGPQVTRIVPEIVWVTVTGMDGDLFQGRVQNQPHNVRTVHRGQQIRFFFPQGAVYPILVTDKYLQECGAWIIHPCRQCGLSELFDAPSDLFRVLFPQQPRSAELNEFPVICPQCEGEQGLAWRGASVGSDVEAEPHPTPAHEEASQTGQEAKSLSESGLGGTYLETARRWAENMTEIGVLLASIENDASADLALHGLEVRIDLHKDLSRRIESYQMSEAAHRVLAITSRAEYLEATSGMTVSRLVVQNNALVAQSKAPGKAKEIEAVMTQVQ
jgi:hypothetical protein